MRRWRASQTKTEANISSDVVSDPQIGGASAYIAESDTDSATSSVSATSSITSNTTAEVLNVEEEVEGLTLTEKLQGWATKNNCTVDTVNDILKILSEEGLNVPKDRRTLLETMRTVPVIDKAGGQYVYMGISDSLQKSIKIFSGEEIRLKVNIDGIPIYKSTKTSLWPITAMAGSIGPIAIAFWYGPSKPSSVEEYLEEFVDEVKVLLGEGITINGQQYPFFIDAFICDAPARSLLKGTISHTGYGACERCTIHGERMCNRTVYTYPETSSVMRTDEGFRDGEYMMGDHPHQLVESPLVTLGFPLVTGFPLDYKHLVLLGVQRRILSFLKGSIKGTVHGKLSSVMLDVISSGTSGLLNCSLPSEFVRQPRSLMELDYWKATEFRSFLLYTGMVVLKCVLSKEMYKHFLSLSIAIRMLCESNSEKREYFLPSARELLNYFVWNAHEHYGLYLLFTTYMACFILLMMYITTNAV